MGNLMAASRGMGGMVPPIPNPKAGLIAQMTEGMPESFGKIGGIGRMAPMEMGAEVTESPRQRAARQKGQRAKRVAPAPTPTSIAPAARPGLGISPRPEIQNRALTNKLNMY